MWEAQDTNTPESGLVQVKKHKIRVPVAYDTHVDGSRVSVVMQRFGTGGTPWTIVIDKKGIVRMNEVTPKDSKKIVALIERLRADEG